MKNGKWVLFALLWASIVSLLMPLGSVAGTERWPRPGPRPDREIPADGEVAWFVSPEGDDGADGRTRTTAWRTLQRAADVVEPGDTVLALRGTYPQGFHLKRSGRPDAWIAFVAEPGAEIRGSEIRRDWVRIEGTDPIYASPQPRLPKPNPDRDLKQRTEQVFVDGELLLQVPDPAMLKPRNTFFADDANKRFLVCLTGGRDPNETLTEVTVQTYAIAIGGVPGRNQWSDEQVGLENRASYVRIDGFTIRHIANHSRMAAIEVRGRCEHVLIENCDIQWVNSRGIAVSGVGYFDTQARRWILDYPGHITVRHCTASHCGVQAAASGGGGGDVVFAYNLFDNNNYKAVSPWAEGGGIKSLGMTNVVMRGNLLRNNDNHGLWFDYGNHGGHIIENNLVFNCLAGALLNEVTPAPTAILHADGSREVRVWTLDELLTAPRAGTIMRNNILIGTRTPGGVGIPNSSSSDAKIYNNIVAFNHGAGIAIEGSPTRSSTTGSHRNRAWANIVYRNLLHARMTLDQACPRGMIFDNLMVSNLFSRAEAELPFTLGGVPSDAAAFTAHNQGAPNVFEDVDPFVDAENWNFTLSSEGAEIARAIRFDPDALRLDWSEFFVERPRRATTDRSSLAFMPVDLGAFHNRGLIDEVAADDQGGWSDQGPNDMRHLPLGRQVFDGVVFQLGEPDRGAVLLENDRILEAEFPSSVEIPIQETYDELYFLYTAVWLSRGETARVVVRYADGTTVEQPLVAGRHLYDWWTDPTWQENESINLNGAYVAWQGPNGQVSTVTTYYYRWVNPRPEAPIASVVLTNAHRENRSLFFLLALSGAQQPLAAAAAPDMPMRVPFNGDVDGFDSRGRTITASGYNAVTFDAGQFVDGREGRRAFVARRSLIYTMPADFPLAGTGSLSVWLKPDPWDTPEWKAKFAAADWLRSMTLFELRRRGAPWRLVFRIDPDNDRDLHLHAALGGQPLNADVSERVRAGEWFHLAGTWMPDPDHAGNTLCIVYVDGREVARHSGRTRSGESGTELRLGAPTKGARWRGAMQDFTVLSHTLTPEEIHITGR